MKQLIILILTCATLAFANIYFPYIPPSFYHPQNATQCLRAQACTFSHKCMAIRAFGLAGQDATPPRSDGRCGKDFNNATCDANGPYGPCCSKIGYCGKTEEHCLISNGCQSGCTDNSPPSQSLSTIPLSEPTLFRPTTSASASSATGAVTADGTCGAAHGGTVCGNWPLGSCCSM